jgi:antitoxin component of RelBE/YafQ-DinJ toxin-antitoxin module
MTEAIAAPVAAPVEPVTAPNVPAPATAVPGGAAPDVTPTEAKAARIAFSKMDPNTIVEMTGPGGKPMEKTAAEWEKFFGRAESADQRFKAAAKSRAEEAQSRAEVAAAIQDLEDAVGDPREFYKRLKKFGLDPDQYAEVMRKHAADEAALTPEQRELRELKAERARREAEDETKAEQAEREQFERARDNIRSQYKAKFTAIQDEMGIPKGERLREHLTRDLFQYAKYLRDGDESRGIAPRDMTRADAKNVIRDYMVENGLPFKGSTPPAPPPEPLRAAPPLPPRDPSTGKFQPPATPGMRGDRRVVKDIRDIFR